jgi:hypothetical protein
MLQTVKVVLQTFRLRHRQSRSSSRQLRSCYRQLRSCNRRLRSKYRQLKPCYIFGDEINEQKWSEIKDTGLIPEYLADIELGGELGRQLCGTIPDDSHLIETTPPDNSGNNTESLVDEKEGDDVDELLSDDLLKKLLYTDQGHFFGILCL